MGKLAGFGNPGVEMIRIGKCYDYAGNSVKPKDFTLHIEAGKCSEAWAEGVSTFHNPNAKYPLDASLFPTAGHHYLKDGRIDSYLPDFFPLVSVTQIITVSDNASDGG